MKVVWFCEWNFCYVKNEKLNLVGINWLKSDYFTNILSNYCFFSREQFLNNKKEGNFNKIDHHDEQEKGQKIKLKLDGTCETIDFVDYGIEDEHEEEFGEGKWEISFTRVFFRLDTLN